MPAAKSVQKAKPVEIHVFKRVRPATKEGVAHATDKHRSQPIPFNLAINALNRGMGTRL